MRQCYLEPTSRPKADHGNPIVKTTKCICQVYKLNILYFLPDFQSIKDLLLRTTIPKDQVCIGWLQQLHHSLKPSFR